MNQLSKPHFLIIDAMNFIHRSRAGLQVGENAIVFNFFRSFRAIVDQFKPAQVYFILDGHAKRKDSTPEYKANRIITDEKKLLEMQNVWRQKAMIVQLLTLLPVNVLVHPEHEADDLIYNLLLKSEPNSSQWTIVSSDSDFIQLLDSFSHVQLYNPIKKEFVEKPEYDYITWKALRGDPSDNIKGIPGVGDKTAAMLALDYDKLTQFLSVQEHADVFVANSTLIEFIKFDDDEINEIQSSCSSFNIQKLKQEFDSLQFKSITNDKSWNKFVATFNALSNS